MEILNYWFWLIQHFPFKDHAVILGKKNIYSFKLHMSSYRYLLKSKISWICQISRATFIYLVVTLFEFINSIILCPIKLECTTWNQNLESYVIKNHKHSVGFSFDKWALLWSRITFEVILQQPTLWE